jgi:hypothetical protein
MDCRAFGFVSVSTAGSLAPRFRNFLRDDRNQASAAIRRKTCNRPDLFMGRHFSINYFVDRPRRADYTDTATACIAFTRTGASDEGENQ